MVLHSLMHAGLSSKKAEKGDGHRKRHEWIERDLKKEGHWQSVTSIPAAPSTVTKIIVLQPEASLLFQLMESGQASCSCSICCWRSSGEEFGPQKGWEEP